MTDHDVTVVVGHAHIFIVILLLGSELLLFDVCHWILKESIESSGFLLRCREDMPLTM